MIVLYSHIFVFTDIATTSRMIGSLAKHTKQANKTLMMSAELCVEILKFG